MAYNFLGLVNDVNRALNEVELTSANFASANGWYNEAKSAVHSAIRKINQEGIEWPFNHTRHSETLVINQVRYSLPANAKSVVWNSFQVVGDTDLGNRTQALWQIDYEDYLAKWSDMEYNPGNYDGAPVNVFRARGDQFGIIPPPDKAYDIFFEYYAIPIDLEDWDDVPTIPETFRYVIRDGALHNAYLFRGDVEASSIKEQRFLDGIKDMRTIYTNRYEYVRSTQLIR